MYTYRKSVIFAGTAFMKKKIVSDSCLYLLQDLHTQTRMAALSDNLDLSVNYGDVCHFIGHLMTEKTFRLIESARNMWLAVF